MFVMLVVQRLGDIYTIYVGDLARRSITCLSSFMISLFLFWLSTKSVFLVRKLPFWGVHHSFKFPFINTQLIINYMLYISTRPLLMFIPWDWPWTLHPTTTVGPLYRWTTDEQPSLASWTIHWLFRWFLAWPNIHDGFHDLNHHFYWLNHHFHWFLHHIH